MRRFQQVAYVLTTFSVMMGGIVVYPLIAEEQLKSAEVSPVSAAGSAAGGVQPAELKRLSLDDGTVNYANPSWSGEGELIALERSDESKKEINILRSRDFSFVKKIYYQLDDDSQGLGLLIPGVAESISYNAGLAWSRDGKHFIFMSNAGEGNYDLYLGDILSNGITRLTEGTEKDAMPDWSPVKDEMVFVSGRTGGAQVYWMEIASRKVKQLTNSDKTHLYPMWSPDGSSVVFMRGDNENHDIIVRKMTAEGSETPISKWSHDDIRPTWSPDGKFLAFYTNYNVENEVKSWSLAVVRSDGSDLTESADLSKNIVAQHVIPDVEKGPAWLSDSQHIAYIKDVKEDYNPIYVVNIKVKNPKKIVTGTKMNHDVAVSKSDLIAFRAQIDQWDRIFVMKLAIDKLGEI